MLVFVSLCVYNIFANNYLFYKIATRLCIFMGKISWLHFIGPPCKFRGSEILYSIKSPVTCSVAPCKMIIGVLTYPKKDKNKNKKNDTNDENAVCTKQCFYHIREMVSAIITL